MVKYVDKLQQKITTLQKESEESHGISAALQSQIDDDQEEKRQLEAKIEQLQKQLQEQQQQNESENWRLSNLVLNLQADIAKASSLMLSTMFKINRSSIKYTKQVKTRDQYDVWDATWKGFIPARVKTLKSGMSVSSFLQEAEVMAILQHPNLIELFGICSEGEPVLFMTEKLTETLFDFVRSAQKSLEVQPQLITIASKVASGMAYMESHGYIHSNLLARTVYIGREGKEVKIGGFNLARALPQGNKHTSLPEGGKISLQVDSA